MLLWNCEERGDLEHSDIYFHHILLGQLISSRR